MDAASVEIKNKTEVLIEYEQLIEELKQKSHELGILNGLNLDLLKTKEVRISELEKEIMEEMQANELLKSITGISYKTFSLSTSRLKKLIFVLQKNRLKRLKY